MLSITGRIEAQQIAREVAEERKRNPPRPSAPPPPPKLPSAAEIEATRQASIKAAFGNDVPIIMAKATTWEFEQGFMERLRRRPKVTWPGASTLLDHRLPKGASMAAHLFSVTMPKLLERTMTDWCEAQFGPPGDDKVWVHLVTYGFRTEVLRDRFLAQWNGIKPSAIAEEMRPKFRFTAEEAAALYRKHPNTWPDHGFIYM